MFDDLLRRLTATWHGRLRRYEGAHLLETQDFAWTSTTAAFEFAGATWESSYRVTAVDDRPDALELHVTFRVIAGRAQQVAVNAVLALDDWDPGDYLVMPAAVYAGNRFISCKVPYPPLVLDPALRGPDAPTHITDVPRLNSGPGPSRIQLLTRDLSTPAVGVHNPRTHRGLWLLTNQATHLGDSGLEITETDARTRAEISLGAPGMREDRRYTIASMDHPCDDRAADWRPGDEVTLRLRLYSFDCPDVPALFDRFVAVRKDLSGPVTLPHMLPFSASWAIQEPKYNAENWSEGPGYYRVGIGESPYADCQVGWVGGGMVTHPLLFEGSAESQARARRNLDYLFGVAQAPSGLFYGIGHWTADGMVWLGDGFFNPGTERWHLIRKSADTLYFAYKQLLLVERQTGEPAPPAWIAGAQRAADAFVRLWDRYGQFGQFVDVETGELVVGNSASGSTAAGGLALAGQHTGNPDYLRVARAAGEDFYRRFVRNGYTTGGPGEICQCPDSESAFGLLESFVTLYEVTGEPKWVEYAQDMAHQCASWVTSYDFAFPPTSLFGRLDMHAAGSVWANAQNKHGAPGICTLSGDALFKLYRATGDTFYLELLREIAHSIGQCLSRADRSIGDNMPPGWMTERVNLSDWLEGVGEIFPGSCWCEVSLMQTYAEVPGLYVQPDTGFVWPFDHIDAAVVANEPDRIVVELTNPTAFPASVRAYVEPSSAMQQPLGQNALWGGQVVHLAAGTSACLEFRK